ncbi:MAG: hypothetical protein R3E01_03615 [Pirellulaceae bacterium]|nr:hypothetical protein [Planctomycetales bacterium]
MTNDQRRKKYIDQQVQGSLARRLVAHWVIFLAVSAIVAFAMQVLMDPFQPLSTHFGLLRQNQGPFLLVALLMIPVFVNDSIKLSHRFVGPVSRLRRKIIAIGNGDRVDPLKLRPGDFWHELANEFNIMLSRIERPTGGRTAEHREEDERELEKAGY